MSEDTPNCQMRQNAPLKKIVFAGTCHLTPQHFVFQDQDTSNSFKNDTTMTCLNMKLRSCPRVIYELDISVQAIRLSLLFFGDNVLIFTLLLCYY